LGVFVGSSARISQLVVGSHIATCLSLAPEIKKSLVKGYTNFGP
jgi:hypothetical protein